LRRPSAGINSHKIGVTYEGERNTKRIQETKYLHASHNSYRQNREMV